MKLRIIQITLAFCIGVAAVILLSGYLSHAAPLHEGIEIQRSGSSLVMETSATPLVFHPTFPKNSYNFSGTVYLQNLSDQETVATLDFKNAMGTVSVDKTVPAKGTLALPADMVTGLDDGQYALVVASQQPVESVVEIYNSVDNKLASYRGVPSSNASTTLYFSPFFDGSGLIIFNASGISAEFQIDFIAGDGSSNTFGPYTVLSQETYAIYGPTLPGLPSGTYLARVTASQSVVGVMYHNNLAGDSGGYEIYGSKAISGLKQYMPRAMKSYSEGGMTRTTQLMVSNLGLSATEVTLYYTNPTAGTFQQVVNLQAGGSKFINLDTVSVLPAGTVWAVTAESNSEDIILGEYTPTGAKTTCDYEGGGPGTALYWPRVAGSSQEFTVSSVQNVSNNLASTLIEYYNLSGTLVYSQSVSLSPGEVRRDNHILIAGLGTDFAGSAIVTADQSLVAWVDEYIVQEASGDRPDLSTSYKAVSLKTVDTADLLTYTLVLRNTSVFTANAILTDSIPTEMSYILDSASASDGSPVSYSNGELVWSGEIITGTPVVVEFAAEVITGTIGKAITNTADLDDGLGNVASLESASVYNPGYSLSIAEGELFTDVPTVTLRFSWNAEDNITDVKISNDGGFGAEGDTTDWIPVNPADPTYSDWVLSTYEDWRLPRTVYIKFRDGLGTPYGPFQDDIISDPIPPQVSSVEIIPLSAVGLQAKGGMNVIVRVTSSDDNSGVAEVNISDDGGFTEYSSYPVTSGVTDFMWELQPSGLVYVRVVDRSGNLSEVVIEQGPTSDVEIYLPLTLGG